MWVGGAAIVTQVNVFTVGGSWAGSNEDLITTITDSAGTSASVTTTPAGTNEETDVRDVHLVALQAATNALFTAITWTSSGTLIILGTAVVPGVPFAASVSEDSASGTYVLTNDGSGSSILSEGPEDLDVDGSSNYASSNWVIANGATSVKPAANDTARFNTGSFDVKYGLNQSSIDLDEMRRTPGYKGVIGDPVKGLFLRYGVSNANDQAVTINSVVGDTWLHVTTDDIFVIALPRSANALRLKGDVGNINVNGSAVQGTITCADAMVLDNFFADECQAMVAKIGAVTSLEKVHVGSGHVTLDMGSGSIVTGVQVWGNATVIHKGLTGASVALWEGFGGLSEYNGEGTLSLLEWHTGTFSLENSTADTVAIDGTNQRGGIVTDEGGAVNVVWSSFIRFGGGGSVSATLNQFK